MVVVPVVVSVQTQIPSVPLELHPALVVYLSHVPLVIHLAPSVVQVLIILQAKVVVPPVISSHVLTLQDPGAPPVPSTH